MIFKSSFIPFSLLIVMSYSFAQVQSEPAFPNLSFTRPVDLQHANDSSNRLFVVEQAGIIRVFDNDSLTNSAGIFLDITGRVNDTNNEEGLLGVAFHPDYAQNGYFFVNYTASQPNRTVISRFKVSDVNPSIAEPDSELVILEFSQPYSNHNGGQIAFGPLDGFLYIASGDGGSFGDPSCNAQNRQTLLGAMLRIDVSNATITNPYQIPPDNPFYNNSQGYREEIFAYGLRNPWRFSIDPATGWIWTGDVGQGQWEEIDLIVNGGNYGWSMFESFHCYNSPWPCTPPCDSTGLIMPIWEYNHSVGQSITGGYVYRGSTVPELAGKYVYADYVSGRIWTLFYDAIMPTVNSLLMDTNLQISSFGIDQEQELYICAFDGRIYKFTSASTPINPGNEELPDDLVLMQNFPNPLNPETQIVYQIKQAGFVKLQIFNIIGQEVRTLVQQIQASGVHHVIWDGRDDAGNAVSSGSYIYQIESGDEVRSKRLTILR